MIHLQQLISSQQSSELQKALFFSIKQHAEQHDQSPAQLNQKMHWIARYLQFHNKQHPLDLNQADIQSFLFHLASSMQLGFMAQKAALSAIRFLYQDFFKLSNTEIDFEKLQLISTIESNRYFKRFGENTCLSLLEQVKGPSYLVLSLAIKMDLSINDVLGLRIDDVCFKQNTLQVSNSRPRPVTLKKIPIELIIDLRIQKMRAKHKIQQIRKSIPRQTVKTANLFCNKENQANPFLFGATQSSKNPLILLPLERAIVKQTLKSALKQRNKFVQFSKKATLSKEHQSKQQKSFQFSTEPLIGEQQDENKRKINHHRNRALTQQPSKSKNFRHVA